MKRARLLLIICLLAAAACRNHTDIARINTLTESLNKSNKVIALQTEQLYLTLKNIANETYYHSNTKPWLPKILRVKEMSNDLYRYIDSLEKVPKEPFDLSKRLSGKLTTYQQAIIDLFKPEGFGDDSTVQLPLLKNSLSGQALLTKALNDVLIFENAVATYCFNHAPRLRMRCEFYLPVIGLTSSYVKKGQTISLTAGIGDFINPSDAKVIINGTQVNKPLDKPAEFKMVANGAPGKHFIPIKIEFTRPDGVIATFEKNIEYEIAP